VDTTLEIIGLIAVVIVIGIIAATFGIPAFVPDKRPDKETVQVIAVIAGLIAIVIIGTVLWEKFA
jgi:uncharacterized membrane protein YidH (DUF202 family)|tara:strand:- start:925 stop:1119 length:195 start_codon:yes stop_codon:yes gene_type:complete